MTERTNENPEPMVQPAWLTNQAEKIQKLKDRKSILENEILQEQYSVEFEEFESADLKAAAEAALEKKQKSLQTLEKSLAMLVKPQAKNSTKSLVDMQKTSLRVAGTLKKFKASTPPEVFWHQYQQGVKTYHLQDREAIMLLHSLVTEHPMGTNWYANNVQEAADALTVAEVKNLFYSEFLEANWQTARLMDLMDIRYQAKETVKDFTNRFAALMQSNEFGWAENNKERAFLKHVLFYKCPYSVQRIIGNKTPDDYESCAALANDLCHFIGVPVDIPPPPTCSKCKKALGDPKKSHVDKEKKGSKQCQVHGWGNHADQDCYRHTDKEKKEQAPKKRKEPGMCFAEGCTEKFTPDHAQVCAFRTKKPKFGKTKVVSFAGVSDDDIEVQYDDESEGVTDAVVDKEEIDYDYDRDFFFNMTKVNDEASDFIYAPAVLDGHRVMAGVDSMANRCFVSPKLAKSLKKKVWPLAGKIVLGTKGHKSDRVGLIRDVVVEIGNKTFKHDFEVLDISDNTEAVFGIDIFGKAGFGILGEPVDYLPEAIDAKVEVREYRTTAHEADLVKRREVTTELGLKGERTTAHEADLVKRGEVTTEVGLKVAGTTAERAKLDLDIKPYKGVDIVKIAIDLDQVNKANQNYSVLYAVYLIKLQELLDNAIEKNRAIRGFCTLPGATVEINVGDSPPVNRRQYRVEFTLQKVVDEQVRKWLESAVIVLSRGHSAWNNPLLVVPKRNAGGEVTGWRVCIDPRP